MLTPAKAGINPSTIRNRVDKVAQQLSNPDKPVVVLEDYKTSKSANAAYSLLDEFKGTPVCDGASNFNLVGTE